MNNVLIILGMHRSGTSLVAGWLNSCQLNLGDRLAGGGIGNKKGHFEDLDFLELHEEILFHYKINKTGLIPPFNFELNEYYTKKLKSNVQFKNSLHEQWGWKEPRTCLFIKQYAALLPKAKYLILYRDYKFVVESLIRRDFTYINNQYENLNKTEQKAQYKSFKSRVDDIQLFINVYLSTWITYNQNIIDLIKSTEKDNYIILSYNRFVDDDKKIFETLKKWKFKLNYIPFTSFFEPGLINEDLPKITFSAQLEKDAIAIKAQMLNLLTI
ncbi:MAG TPA: hypothetical protein VL490_04275 [Mucilaginibacter sp.]|jgi:hypothetical protein|nr:hypothetical protein [Mucilaginibacter sp.]